MRFAAFDLDGTLLRGDTVLEAIARPLGRLDRTREFERLTQRADIKMAREEVATWYEGHGFSELRSYLETMNLAPGAHSAFRLLKRYDIKTAIVSITWEFAVEWFAQKLGAEFM